MRPVLKKWILFYGRSPYILLIKLIKVVVKNKEDNCKISSDLIEKLFADPDKITAEPKLEFLLKFEV